MLCDVCKEREARRAAHDDREQRGDAASTCARSARRSAASRRRSTIAEASAERLPAGGAAAVGGASRRDAGALHVLLDDAARISARPGRLGCAHCYDDVRAEPARAAAAGARQLAARRPARTSRRTPELLERSSMLGELRERLRRAIETEQFELAADLRDQIKGLE